jgi:hypothetical protein
MHSSDPAKAALCCIGNGLLYADRGFDEVIEGYEDPRRQPLFQFLSLLSGTNRSFVMIGDSMMNQWFRAFVDEVKRENITESTLEMLSPQNQSWYELYVKPSSKKYLMDYWRWTPSPLISSNTDNPVYMYLLESWQPIFDHSLLFGKSDHAVTVIYWEA